MTNSLNVETHDGKQISEEELIQLVEDIKSSQIRKPLSNSQHFETIIDGNDFYLPKVKHLKSGNIFRLYKGDVFDMTTNSKQKGTK